MASRLIDTYQMYCNIFRVSSPDQASLYEVDAKNFTFAAYSSDSFETMICSHYDTLFHTRSELSVILEARKKLELATKEELELQNTRYMADHSGSNARAKNQIWQSLEAEPYTGIALRDQLRSAPRHAISNIVAYDIGVTEERMRWMNVLRQYADEGLSPEIITRVICTEEEFGAMTEAHAAAQNLVGNLQ
jgi:hypothetical protein